MGVCDGVVNALSSYALGVCPPPHATLDQAVRTVSQYIDARPERLHEEFNRLAVEALRAAPGPAIRRAKALVAAHVFLMSGQRLGRRRR
jgi:Rap1a immunity proteins